MFGLIERTCRTVRAGNRILMTLIGRFVGRQKRSSNKE
jgi:hypothetical protein